MFWYRTSVRNRTYDGYAGVVGSARTPARRGARSGRGGQLRAGACARSRRRIGELGARRQQLGAGERAVERRDARARDDRVAEALAVAVLAQLQLQPEQPLEQRGERRALGAAALERARAAAARRDERRRRRRP